MIAMETGLKIFEKPEFGSVRVVEKDGDPWFVARDVCEALGFDEYNTNNATKGLDDDEKSTILKVLGRNDLRGLLAPPFCLFPRRLWPVNLVIKPLGLHAQG